ncbi:MAG TPA: hypothetical protein VFQ39_06480, partial [Longimicrobium sp.]|nr:hypothetical protein [Longimicrobium sp.]
AEETGFSVLYNRLRARQLLDFLRHDRDPDTGEAWTRLCFKLALRNPYFVNFTELPVDTNPSRRNLYLTNRQAHREGDEVILPPGDRADVAELVPVTGGQFRELTPEGVFSVSVRAVDGREVICKPRCVRPDAAENKPPDAFDCADAALPGQPGICTDALYFDLSGFPEEKYFIETTYEGGTPPPATAEYLYAAGNPIPLCFVELLFADPTGDGTGVYPVTGADEDAIHAVTYVLPFAARETWWSYFVVARTPEGERGELRIRQRRGSDEPRVAFRGPCCVTLSGGRRAWRFVSRAPIAVRQRSPLHLQLVWRAEGGRTRVLMDRLPLASGDQVLPLTERDACLRAEESLCPDARGSPRCRALLRELCGPGVRPDPYRRNYSDIYVHV